MKLKYDPVAYVRSNGQAYHKVVVLAKSNSSSNLTHAIRELISLQNVDGGWPFKWQKQIPSSIPFSAKALDVLTSAKANGEAEFFQKATTFLLKHQNLDGGWAENYALQKYIPKTVETLPSKPKEPYWSTTSQSVTWITGIVLSALVDSKFQNRQVIDKAVSFLVKNQLKNGGWIPYKGYTFRADISSTGTVVKALLKAGLTRDSLIFRRTRECVVKEVRELEYWKEPIQAVAALETFLMLGDGAKSKYCKLLIETLINQQRPDGGWNPVSSKHPSEINITTAILEVFIEYIPHLVEAHLPHV